MLQRASFICSAENPDRLCDGEAHCLTCRDVGVLAAAALLFIAAVAGLCYLTGWVVYCVAAGGVEIVVLSLSLLYLVSIIAHVMGVRKAFRSLEEIALLEPADGGRGGCNRRLRFLFSDQNPHQLASRVGAWTDPWDWDPQRPVALGYALLPAFFYLLLLTLLPITVALIIGLVVLLGYILKLMVLFAGFLASFLLQPPHWHCSQMPWANFTNCSRSLTATERCPSDLYLCGLALIVMLVLVGLGTWGCIRLSGCAEKSGQVGARDHRPARPAGAAR